MMPKGVEHLKFRELPPDRQEVRIPMMPKGVEHKEKYLRAKAAVLNAFRHHRQQVRHWVGWLPRGTTPECGNSNSEQSSNPAAIDRY